MDRLHILRPDTITRVSEYVPEIVSFVQGIMDNGFAYEGGGSIWFDVTKFEGADGKGFKHEYAKLQPGSKGNKKLLDEGEGELWFRLSVAPAHDRRVDRIAGKATSGRLCVVEGQVETWRTGMAVAVGRRPTGMAHRVLCHGQRGTRQGNGRAFRRCRLDVPAPRQ